jgi:hypothetical protein
MSTLYINRESVSNRRGSRETVDETDEGWKYARFLVREYRLGDPDGDYWISHRACAGWTVPTTKEA